MILVKVIGVSPGKDKVCFSQDGDSHIEKWHPGSSWLVFLDDGIILRIQHWSLWLADGPGIQKQQLAQSWWDREHYIFLGVYTSATCTLYSHAHEAINAMIRERGWLIITGQIILSIWLFSVSSIKVPPCGTIKKASCFLTTTSTCLSLDIFS